MTWTLRVLLIIMILFFALFSLDVFEEGQSFWNTIAALLMHNIPSFIMIVILVIAWKREQVGGVILMVFMVAFGLFFFLRSGNFMYGTLIMLGIPFLIGVLFVVNHYFLGKKE